MSKAQKKTKRKSAAAISEELQQLMADVEILKISQVGCDVNSTVNALFSVEARDVYLNIEKKEYQTLQPEGEDFIYCGVRLEVKLMHEPNPGSESESVASFRAEYAILYSLNSDKAYSREALSSFARTNAVFNAWPFFREFVQSSGNRMGFDNVVIPLMRMPIQAP